MEEVLPPQTESGSGFERTGIPQFTIFLENRVGKLSPLVQLLEGNVGTINALQIEECADAALVRVICSNPDDARVALKEQGYSFSETDVLAVELPRDKARPISAICTALLSAEINIHSSYPLLSRPHGPALALYVDDATLAARILIRKGFTIVGESDLKL